MELQMQDQAKDRLKDQILPDVSVDQRASNEIIKLIRKLRWVGMEGEAKRLQIALNGVVPADSVVAEPRETD